MGSADENNKNTTVEPLFKKYKKTIHSFIDKLCLFLKVIMQV
jgi:hypothetical protein